MKMEELGATLMNIQLVESLAQIINSLTPEEQELLNQKKLKNRFVLMEC
jgi:hypothetical protein